MSISNEQVISFVKKNPIGVGCFVLSAALAAAIYLRNDLVPAAAAELDEKEALSDRLAANLTYGKDLPEQMQQLTEDIKAINSRLIGATQILTNQQYFYNLETVTGTKIATPQMTNPAGAKGAKGSFIPIAFSLNVQGSYAQVIDFLNRLENGVHFCRILNARCARAGAAVAGGNPDVITLNLSLELLGQP
jgi:hypothetical protein